MLMVMCAFAVQAQNTKLTGVTGDQYVISAKAGGVNFVSGTVSVFRKNGTSGYLLAGDELQIGDRVTTAADGKAEILLNPGSYMRLGGSTSFEFITTDLENLKVSLKTGSAVFEVYAANEFRVSVKMPLSTVALTHTGVFRFDVLPDGTSKLLVFKGKAYVGPMGQTEVNSGREAALVKGGISVSKFDKDANDALDIWSKLRGKELTKLNASLQRNSLRNSLMSSFGSGSGWNMYHSFGLWVFDPNRRMWCFLPFGYGWSSPYGWGYDFDIWNCRLPWYTYREPFNPPNSGGSGGGGITPGPTGSGIATSADRGSSIPPFQRVQSSGGGSSSGNSRSDGDTIFNSPRGHDNSPVFTPRSEPVNSPPIIAPPSAPAETKKPGQ